MVLGPGERQTLSTTPWTRMTGCLPPEQPTCLVGPRGPADEPARGSGSCSVEVLDVPVPKLMAEEVVEARAVVSLDRIQQRIIDPGDYQVNELVPQEPVRQGTVAQVLDQGFVVPLEPVPERIGETQSCVPENLAEVVEVPFSALQVRIQRRTDETNVDIAVPQAWIEHVEVSRSTRDRVQQLNVAQQLPQIGQADLTFPAAVLIPQARVQEGPQPSHVESVDLEVPPVLQAVEEDPPLKWDMVIDFWAKRTDDREGEEEEQWQAWLKRG